jgi:hypothetical protein
VNATLTKEGRTAFQFDDPMRLGNTIHLEYKTGGLIPAFAYHMAVFHFVKIIKNQHPRAVLSGGVK